MGISVRLPVARLRPLRRLTVKPSSLVQTNLLSLLDLANTVDRLPVLQALEDNLGHPVK